MLKAQKSFISQNLRFLRQTRSYTQASLANDLDMTRVKYASYESAINKNPPVEDLMRVSTYFKISIDTLVKVNLQKLSKSQFNELLAGNDTFVSGSKLRVLATTVNSDNKDNIEYVPVKAKAGYLNGYQDPEFVTSLPSFHLPVVKNDRKHRLFPVTGDSMLPFPENAFMIGEYVDDWANIKDGEKCLIISLEQGFVLKEVYNSLKKDKTLLLKSTNTLYKPYEMNVENILEIWRFAGYIDLKWPQQAFSIDEVLSEVDLLKSKIVKLQPARSY